LGNTYFWHAAWYGLVYFGLLMARKPIFVPRFIAVEAGKADSLITAADKKVALGFAVGTIRNYCYDNASTNESSLLQTPLQAGLLRGINTIEMACTNCCC